MISSKRWKHSVFVLSAAYVILFITWRMILNSLSTILLYLCVHLYQFFGIIVCYLLVEKDEYFTAEKVRCLEIVFFCFIATLYSPFMFILNTRDRVYGDPEDSPCCCLVALVPIPFFVTLFMTPFIDTEQDLLFWFGYFLYGYFFAYCSYAIVDNLMHSYRCKWLACLNPLTWIVAPAFLMSFYFNKEKIKQEAIQRRQRQIETEQEMRERRSENRSDEVDLEESSGNLPKEVLNRGQMLHYIPCVDRKAKYIKNLECAICLSGFESEARKALLCGHAFHEECIQTWLDEYQTCPVCRRPVEYLKEQV
ncbi:unnamed protein product [Moneuplotes crassus]|uniref:RING-type domain-containing protein n=1 Tax=Euplotes crassus TaxID=5936 RepID=A0AAD1UU34_EUPCR|nr:unnamed protein product [Moneuplotes crassus]